jgi:hypothetical protein
MSIDYTQYSSYMRLLHAQQKMDWRVENKSIFFQGFLGFDYGKEKCKTLSSIFFKFAILRHKNKIINYIIYTIFSNTK